MIFVAKFFVRINLRAFIQGFMKPELQFPGPEVSHSLNTLWLILLYVRMPRPSIVAICYSAFPHSSHMSLYLALYVVTFNSKVFPFVYSTNIYRIPIKCKDHYLTLYVRDVEEWVQFLNSGLLERDLERASRKKRWV